MHRGDTTEDGDVGSKSGLPEVLADFDVAAMVGLMPGQSTPAYAPSWCDQDLIQTVAGSQVRWRESPPCMQACLLENSLTDLSNLHSREEACRVHSVQYTVYSAL